MDKDEHDARNAAQAEQDRADAFDAELLAMKDRCSVYECGREGSEEYRVCPPLICDPDEINRWPVVLLCKSHMQEIMGEDQD